MSTVESIAVVLIWACVCVAWVACLSDDPEIQPRQWFTTNDEEFDANGRAVLIDTPQPASTERR